MNNVSLVGFLQSIRAYNVFTNQRTGKPRPSIIFSMYTLRSVRDPKSGQYHAQPDFFSVLSSGPDAKYVKTYGSHGAVVSVDGRIENHDYKGITTDQIRAFNVDLPRPHTNNNGGNSQQPAMNNNQPMNNNAPQNNRMPQSPNNVPRNNGGFNRGNTPTQNQSFNNAPRNTQSTTNNSNSTMSKVNKKPIDENGNNLPF